MRIASFMLSSLLCAARLLGQGPFQFREEYLLEHRIETERSGEKYSSSHEEEFLSKEGPSQARQALAGRDNLNIYRTARWLELLDQTDLFRRMGGIDLAKKQYLAMLEMVRKMQGSETTNVALMLDHIGEFYLELRDCAKAYEYLTAAVQVRRRTIDTLPQRKDDAQQSQAEVRLSYRLHLADLLTRLGQLDLARGELGRAGDELSEAVVISNENVHLPYVGGLYALYFRSLVLERQAKWQEAEALWRDAVRRREVMSLSDAYWNTMKEMAAFFARWNDYRSAAEIARQVEAGVGGRTMEPESSMPYFDSRPRAIEMQPQFSWYTKNSRVAMREIMAIDKWQADGPDAAALLLQDPVREPNEAEHGGDADRAQMLAWLQRRAYLHLSILLDGKPSQKRINRAYNLLADIKGRYLASQVSKKRLSDPEKAGLLDQLGEARAHRAHMFLATANDGKPASTTELLAIENKERILSEAIAFGSRAWLGYFSLDGLRDGLSPDAALLDFVEWQRMDRLSLRLLPPEYGVFVVRNDQRLVYARLGSAAAIDAEIKAAGKDPETAVQALRSLYEQLIAPLEGALGGRPSQPAVVQMLIVPDGLLTLAPFGAFIDGGERHLLERYRISYLDSWRDVGDPAASAPAKSSPPMVIANPDFGAAHGAPGTVPASARRSKLVFTPERYFGDEATDIAQTLRLTSERVLTEKMARKDAVQAVQGPEILHFATHSKTNITWETPPPTWSLFEFPPVLDIENPFLRSVIALAGANLAQTGEENGLLTGLEVGGLDLGGTRLVVLSSCESGWATAVDGQGILGLRSAFSMAGASALVTSLWPVDDQASRKFMAFFYSHLEVEGGPAEALRLAQLEMMTKTEFKEPFYWAGYQCSCGASRPVHAPLVVAAPPVRKVPVAGSPACFELTGHHREFGDTVVDTLRIKLGAVAHRLWETPHEVFYEMQAPESAIEELSVYSNSGKPLPRIQDLVREELDLSVKVRVDREVDESRVFFQIGRSIIVAFIGDPDVFRSLDVPRTLPPLSSYTDAKMSIWRTGGDEKIESVRPCGSAPLRQ